MVSEEQTRRTPCPHLLWKLIGGQMSVRRAGGTLGGGLGVLLLTWESEAQSYVDFSVSCCVSGQCAALESQMRPSA